MSFCGSVVPRTPAGDAARVVFGYRAIIMALALALLGGCLKSAAFSCAVETDCTRGGELGTCEPTGFCSFADAACPGGRRYGELSGSLANQCVGGDNPDGGPPIDAPDDLDSGPPAAPFCDVNEPALVGCWEFEGNLTDGSGDDNNGTSTGAVAVAFVAGQTGMAAQLTAMSRISVADSASLSPQALTIEGWIRPTNLPAGGARQGVLDNNNSYGMFLISTPVVGLSCIGATVAIAITPNVFTHVACTYDAGGNRIYVDGTEVANVAAGGPLGAGDATGPVLGGNSNGSLDTLVGEIDQLRVWNVARTAQQVCTAAGRTTCP
jgi:hypothetical protein